MTSAATYSRTANVGRHFFVIENLPMTYTWQDLKDLIRREASHGIWTEMAFYPNGQTGGKGHARVKRDDEARNLYRYLTTNVIEGRRLRIHLWDISGPKAEFRYCNCESTSTHSTQGYPAQRIEVDQIAVAPGWQVFTPPSPPMTASQASYPTSPTVQYPVSPPTSPQRPVASLQPAQIADVMARLNSMNLNGTVLNPRDPAHVQYTANWIQQRQLQQQQCNQAVQVQAQVQAQAQAGANRAPATYAYAPSGIPVNLTNGSIRTEARGVFVSGLSYKANSRDIEAVFSKAGEISKCEVQKDAATGKSKGKATIRYTTAAGAAQAISMFDKKRFMGMELSVRTDTDRTVVSPPPVSSATMANGQPIIVDGSNAPERKRKDSVQPVY